MSGGSGCEESILVLIVVNSLLYTQNICFLINHRLKDWCVGGSPVEQRQHDHLLGISSEKVRGYEDWWGSDFVGHWTHGSPPPFPVIEYLQC